MSTSFSQALNLYFVCAYVPGLMTGVRDARKIQISYSRDFFSIPQLNIIILPLTASHAQYFMCTFHRKFVFDAVSSHVLANISFLCY